MKNNSIVISSGHGKLIRGASGIIDEVDEARRVVDRVAELLRGAGCDVAVFHDNTSTNQSDNLETIVDFHNTLSRDLDVSVHFNAYEDTEGPMGVECLHVSQEELAEMVADEVSERSGLKNRGPKQRSDLYFLNNTEQPAILIETCFVDSAKDTDLYKMHFDAICAAIAEAIVGVPVSAQPPTPPHPLPPTTGTGDVSIPIVTITLTEGKVSFEVDPPDSVKVVLA